MLSSERPSLPLVYPLCHCVLESPQSTLLLPLKPPVAMSPERLLCFWCVARTAFEDNAYGLICYITGDPTWVFSVKPFRFLSLGTTDSVLGNSSRGAAGIGTRFGSVSGLFPLDASDIAPPPPQGPTGHGRVQTSPGRLGACLWDMPV